MVGDRGKRESGRAEGGGAKNGWREAGGFAVHGPLLRSGGLTGRERLRVLCQQSPDRINPPLDFVH
jgi:hypothetical protein